MKTPKAANEKRKAPRRAQAKEAPSTPQTRKAPPRARKTTAKAAAPSHEDEHDASQAKTTTDLNEIKSWAEARQGKPVTVKGTAPEHEAGLLRIDFPGYSGEGTFEEISWDDWHAKFEEKKLAFLYQEKTKDGRESRFFKLISRHE